MQQDVHKAGAHGPQPRRRRQGQERGPAQGQGHVPPEGGKIFFSGQTAQTRQTGHAEAGTDQAQRQLQQALGIVQARDLTAHRQPHGRQHHQLRRGGPQQAQGQAPQTAPQLTAGGRGGRTLHGGRREYMTGIAPLGQPLGQAPGAHARGQCRRDSLCASRQPARQHGTDDHHIKDDGRKRGQPENFAAVQHRHAQGRHPRQQNIGQAKAEQAAALRQGFRRKRGRQKGQQLRRCQHAQQDKAAQHQHEAPEQAGGQSGQRIPLALRHIVPHQPGRERHGQRAFAQQAAQQMRQAQGRHQGIGHRPAAHHPGHAHVAHQSQQAGKQGEQRQHPGRAGHTGTA